ncbi:hypothetical protein HCC61_17670 [Streptomyces sp. HNM0575]|uniref:DUF6461 domain-containing protein n=1 Tax=Streptomyces sp. HNM0575 TaxID=2716338 RepID=UPI00145D8246|nr:DUF6461 domain-containing protein [Streptomyces sp. HNM0575]NLU74484.1 hypothetical protein [Streptomyces sp. HNM0575]
MVSDPLEDLRWLDAAEGRCPLGGIFSVSFFHGLGPAEVLRRFGAAPSGEPDGGHGPHGRPPTLGTLCERAGDGGGFVGAMRTGEWTAAVELCGWEATLPDVAERLSADCEMVAVTRHDYAEHCFVYAVGGSVVTCFDSHVPGYRQGSAPDGLNAVMRETGLDPGSEEMCLDDPVATSFALAAAITGVVFTRDVLERPLLTGAVRQPLV